MLGHCDGITWYSKVLYDVVWYSIGIAWNCSVLYRNFIGIVYELYRNCIGMV